MYELITIRFLITCQSYFICLNLVFGQQIWDLFFSYEVKKIISSEVRFNPYEEILKQTLKQLAKSQKIPVWVEMTFGGHL